MRVLVTGSSGHLGEALTRTFQDTEHEVIGLDIASSPFTGVVGSIVDRALVRDAMRGVDAVLHTATLHKPHVATHTRQEFVDTNITGTLNLLEEAVAVKVKAFVFTSTTSVYGDAMTPAQGRPAAWITEDVVPAAKNIYGVTKLAAEGLCQLFHRNQGLPCLILRTSRFFPEADDLAETREAYADENIKANEFLYRRVAINDVVSAHLLAIERSAEIGFDKYIISATTPFTRDDLVLLRGDASSVVERYAADYRALYAARGWKMFSDIDRVYVNARARLVLGWQPQTDFSCILNRLRNDESVVGPLATLIGRKGYHDQGFTDGPYPVEA